MLDEHLEFMIRLVCEVQEEAEMDELIAESRFEHRLITSFIKGRTSHLYLSELLAMVGVSLHTAILTALQPLPDAAMLSKYQKIFQGIAIYFRPIKRRCYRTLMRIFIH